MKRAIVLILSLTFLIPFKAWAEEVIKKGESLNLERCIEIALKKHPNIIAAMNTVNINQSRVGQASLEKAMGGR